MCAGSSLFCLQKKTDIDECGENRVAGGTPLCGEGMSCTMEWVCGVITLSEVSSVYVMRAG